MAGRRRASTLAFVLLLVCEAAGEKPELRWLSKHSPSTHSPKHGPSSPHHSMPEARPTSAQPEAVSFLGRVTSFVTQHMKNPYVMAALYALATKDFSFVIAMALWRLCVMFERWRLTMQRGDILARSENQFRMYMQKLEEEEERSRQKHEAYMQRLEEEREAEMDRLDAHNVEPGRAQGSALNEAREQAAQKRRDQAMASAIDQIKAAKADQQRQNEADQNRLELQYREFNAHQKDQYHEFKADQKHHYRELKVGQKGQFHEFKADQNRHYRELKADQKGQFHKFTADQRDQYHKFKADQKDQYHEFKADQKHQYREFKADQEHRHREFKADQKRQDDEWKADQSRRVYFLLALDCFLFLVVPICLCLLSSRIEQTNERLSSRLSCMQNELRTIQQGVASHFSSHDYG